MIISRFTVILITVLVLDAGCAGVGSRPHNTPPPGFVALFNGKDLSGWKGQLENPIKRAAMSPQEHAEAQKAADAKIRQHWRVDPDSGDLVNDGGGPYLATAKKFGDFEMWMDWKMVPKADGGIYLRGSPQVQIWDPVEGGEAAAVGSGALYNNKQHPRNPLVPADKPTGEWNTFHITMVGENVTVHLNGRLVVDNVVMENYWDYDRPIFAREQIELQTHGGEIRYRNVYLREIEYGETKKFLAGKEQGFKSLFNGRNLEGWQGDLDAYEVKNRTIVAREGKSGNLLSEEEFSDFILRFEFKLPPAGNNGLAIWALKAAPNSYQAIELQIIDNSAPKYVDLKPYQYHGSVYGVKPAHRGYLRPVGKWNYQEVVCKGPNISVRVNGTTITELDVSTVKETMDGHDHPGLNRRNGHIGFFGHLDPVAFRNIRIKRQD